jgi:hypothetical protein
MPLINGVHHCEEAYKEIKVRKIFCTPISSSSSCKIGWFIFCITFTRRFFFLGNFFYANKDVVCN